MPTSKMIFFGGSGFGREEAMWKGNEWRVADLDRVVMKVREGVE